MRGARVSSGLVFASAALFAQAGGERLDRFVQRVMRDLARLPNYTCTETIERWRFNAGCTECTALDRLRLEVAVVDNRERFAWPGASHFEDKDIDEIVKLGAVVSGDFSGFARGVFWADHATFQYEGETRLGGRPAARYHYEVSAANSGFRLGVDKDRRLVAYRGSFWVDPQSLELLRLEVSAAPLPDSLKLERAELATDYGKVRIGDADFLLPRKTEMVLVDRSGNKSRNITHYAACRQYVGESTISFEDSAPRADAPPASSDPPRSVPIPAGLPVESTLETSLNLDECAAGDPVEATVTRPAGIIPKGARLRGRVVRLEQRRGSRRTITVLGLELDSLESDGRKTAFRALARDVSGLVPRPGQFAFQARGREAILVLAGPRTLPKGFRFFWETEQQP